jgi:predicted Zn-dependent protease
VLHRLEKEDLLQILRSPKSSVILAKKRDFRAYGIGVEFTDGALALLAERAHEEHTGARSLVGAVEKALISFEKKLPSTSIDHFTVDDAVVCDPEKALQLLLSESSLSNFRQNFANKHGIELIISAEAETLLEQVAAEKNEAPGELCSALFADYGHGLKLAGVSEYTLTADAVRMPQEVLNELIKDYYSRQPS